MRILIIALLIASAVLTIARPVEAQAQQPKSDDMSGQWRFTIAPYLLFPYMDGAVAVRGFDVDVEANPGDIFSKLKIGGMLALEATNGTWAVSLDGLYMNLKQSAERLPIELGMKQGAFEVAGFRRVTEWAEVFVGGRLNFLEASIEGEGPLEADRKQDEVWFDPIVGARLQAPATDKWRLAIRGDIGGFGLGSDFAWQVYPVVGYRFSSLFEAAVAYRWLSMDYKAGDGARAFRYDVTTFGPEVGLLFHF